MSELDSAGSAMATNADIIGILGNLDNDQLLAILALRPTVAEVEQASLWLSGDNDVFGAEPPIKGNAADIITILTAEENEEH